MVHPALQPHYQMLSGRACIMFGLYQTAYTFFYSFIFAFIYSFIQQRYDMLYYNYLRVYIDERSVTHQSENIA